MNRALRVPLDEPFGWDAELRRPPILIKAMLTDLCLSYSAEEVSLQALINRFFLLFGRPTDLVILKRIDSTDESEEYPAQIILHTFTKEVLQPTSVAELALASVFNREPLLYHQLGKTNYYFLPVLYKYDGNRIPHRLINPYQTSKTSSPDKGCLRMYNQFELLMAEIEKDERTIQGITAILDNYSAYIDALKPTKKWQLGGAENFISRGYMRLNEKRQRAKNVSLSEEDRNLLKPVKDLFADVYSRVWDSSLLWDRALSDPLRSLKPRSVPNLWFFLQFVNAKSEPNQDTLQPIIPASQAESIINALGSMDELTAARFKAETGLDKMTNLSVESLNDFLETQLGQLAEIDNGGHALVDYSFEAGISTFAVREESRLSPFDRLMLGPNRFYSHVYVIPIHVYGIPWVAAAITLPELQNEEDSEKDVYKKEYNNWEISYYFYKSLFSKYISRYVRRKARQYYLKTLREELKKRLKKEKAKPSPKDGSVLWTLSEDFWQDMNNTFNALSRVWPFPRVQLAFSEKELDTADQPLLYKGHSGLNYFSRHESEGEVLYFFVLRNPHFYQFVGQREFPLELIDEALENGLIDATEIKDNELKPIREGINENKVSQFSIIDSEKSIDE